MQVLDSIGLGQIAEQLKDLQLGELLDTPPPGVDEAVAISKVRVLRVCHPCSDKILFQHYRVLQQHYRVLQQHYRVLWQQFVCMI